MVCVCVCAIFVGFTSITLFVLGVVVDVGWKCFFLWFGWLVTFCSGLVLCMCAHRILLPFQPLYYLRVYYYCLSQQFDFLHVLDAPVYSCPDCFFSSSFQHLREEELRLYYDSAYSERRKTLLAIRMSEKKSEKNREKRKT